MVLQMCRPSQTPHLTMSSTRICPPINHYGGPRNQQNRTTRPILLFHANPTSVLKVLIWVFATTTKICTRGRSTQDHSQGFVTDLYAGLLVMACSLYGFYNCPSSPPLYYQNVTMWIIIVIMDESITVRPWQRCVRNLSLELPLLWDPKLWQHRVEESWVHAFQCSPKEA